MKTQNRRTARVTRLQDRTEEQNEELHLRTVKEGSEEAEMLRELQSTSKNGERSRKPRAKPKRPRK